jgi:hypothetical protein
MGSVMDPQRRRGGMQVAVRRGALALALVGVSVALAACSGAPTAATAEPVTMPETRAVTAAGSLDVYRALVDSVGLAALEGTRLLNQIALFVTTDEAVRAMAEDDVRLLIQGFELQRQQLEGAEPVPEAAEAAHADLKLALDRYVEAASLLLPASSGGPERFEFSRFQELMQDGGKHFHGAGASLDAAR